MATLLLAMSILVHYAFAATARGRTRWIGMGASAAFIGVIAAYYSRLMSV